MLRNLNQTQATGRVCGTPKSGVLGSAIATTGDYGPGYCYNDLSLPADANKEICGRITTWPSAGTLKAYEDTSFTFTGAPDGIYTFQYQLLVDGVAAGSPVTVTLIVGAVLQAAAAASATASASLTTAIRLAANAAAQASATANLTAGTSVMTAVAAATAAASAVLTTQIAPAANASAKATAIAQLSTQIAMACVATARCNATALLSAADVGLRPRTLSVAAQSRLSTAIAQNRRLTLIQ